MVVHLPIPYDQLIDLIEQLPVEQKNELLAHLLTQQARQRPLTIEEKLTLLDAIKLDVAVKETPSIRREDWYGDDGR